MATGIPDSVTPNPEKVHGPRGYVRHRGYVCVVTAIFLCIWVWSVTPEGRSKGTYERYKIKSKIRSDAP